jgi:hypothetical protein
METFGVEAHMVHMVGKDMDTQGSPLLGVQVAQLSYQKLFPMMRPRV